MTRAAECRTRLEPPDSVGQFGWSCDAYDGDGSGYETPFDAYAAAAAHGPIAADSERVDPAEDMKARLVASDDQYALALAIMRERRDVDAVIVPIALPGKQHGLWVAGQAVVAIGGFWLAREDAPRADPESYAQARDAAEQAADDWLANNGAGQPCYAVIRRNGHASVFEGFSRTDAEAVETGLPTVEALLRILSRLGFPKTGLDALDDVDLPPQRQQTALAMMAMLALLAKFNNHTIEADRLDDEARQHVNIQAALSILDADPASINSCALLVTILARDLVIATAAVDREIPHHPVRIVVPLLMAVAELITMYSATLDPAVAAGGFRPVNPEYLQRAVAQLSTAGIHLSNLATGVRHGRDAAAASAGDEDVDEDSAADRYQR